MTTLIDTLHNLTSSDVSLRVEAQLTVKRIQDSRQVNGYKSLCEALTTILSIDGNTTQSPPVLSPAPEGESMCITTVGMHMYETLADCLEGGGGDDDDDDDDESGGGGKGDDDPIFVFARDSDVVLNMCLAGLTQQFGDSEDDNEWTISTASSKLLQVILQHQNEGRNETCAKLLNFASQRYVSTVWQLRDAAFLVTGCVCSCPDEHVSHLVHTAIIPILLKSIEDQNLTVADSVLWAISCACEHHHEALINFLDAIMTAVIPLISKPRAPGRSARALQIIDNLAKHCLEGAEDEGRAPQTNFMSPYLPSLLAVVVGIIKQQDGCTKTERLSAVETLTSLVGATAGDCVHMLTDWFIVRDLILPRLDKPQAIAEGDDNVVESVVTACLCGTVSTLCSRLGADIAPVSSPLCDALTCAVKAWGSTGNGCVEDGLMAIGALYQTGAMNNDTSGRSQRLSSIATAVTLILSSNIYNRGQYSAALACISDIVLAVQEDFKPHLPLVMATLLSMLENSALHDMHPENKLAIFSTVGDICISCGLKAGEQYYSSIKTIFEAEAASTDNTDEEELLEIISEALEILG